MNKYYMNKTIITEMLQMNYALNNLLNYQILGVTISVKIKQMKGGYMMYNVNIGTEVREQSLLGKLNKNCSLLCNEKFKF